MRIVQAVVAVAPPLLILGMGGAYLLDAGRLLLDPGVPVAFDYKTPDGPVRFRMEGYRIDPARRVATVRGVGVWRANGTRIAALRSAEMAVGDPSSPRPTIRAEGLRLRIERDRRGIDLTRLFPKQEKPTDPIPFRVTVRDTEVTYVDATLSRPLILVARSERIAVDGVGDDLRVLGRFTVPGVGVADVRVQGLPDVGTTVDVRSDALRLEGIAPRFAPGLRVRSLVARGPIRIDLPKNSPPGSSRIAAVVRIEARDVRYRGYAVDATTFDGKAGLTIAREGAAPEVAASGAAVVRIGAVRASFRGTATTRRGGGQVVATVPSRAALPAWVRAQLPPRVDFRDARYAGWAAWEGTVARLDGRATVARGLYGPDAVDAIAARVAVSPERIDVRGLTARWQGAPLAGDLSVDPKAKSVRAAVVAPRLPLAALSRRLGNTAGVTGVIGGEALVSGTLAKPIVEGRMGGNVALKGRSLGVVEARGAWLAGAARVDRLRVSGPLGAIVAGGTIRPDGTLDFRAEARGLRVERLAPDARGLVSANLQVGGTLRSPKATGRLEAYRLAFAGQTLPAAGFDLAADRQRIDLSLFTAVRGTARVSGRVGASLVGPGVRLADPNTWLVDGRASVTGIQVGELPGAEAMDDLAGVVSIPQIDLSGRVGNPVVRARLAGSGLIVRGVRIDSVGGEVRADKKGAALTDLLVRSAGGEIRGRGAYSLAKKSGEIDLAVSDLQLSRLLADVSQDVAVEGTVSAPRVHLVLRDGKPFGNAEGTLTGVKANGVLAGDGNWSLDANGERVVATASVGRLDPTLRALDAKANYNVRAGTLAATVQAKDVPLQAVVAAAQARRESSEDEAERLKTISGDLSGVVSVVRAKDGDLKIDATDLSAAAIRYLDLDYGTLTATSVTRRGGRWTLEGGTVVGPEGRFTGAGWVEENGPLEVRATGEAVKVAAFSPFAPDLAQFTGIAHFDVTATGLVTMPSVKGTAGVDNLFAAQSKEALSLSLDEISIADGRSSVRGTVRYGGLFGGLLALSTDWRFREPLAQASLQAKADFGALGPIDPTDPAKGFKVAAVGLSDVPDLAAYVDLTRTSGASLSGGFAASGTFGAPRLTGGIALRAERLGLNVPGAPGRPITRIDDTLRDVKVDLGFDERNAPLLTASTGFSRGGALEARATLGDLGGESVFDRLARVRDWKGLPIKGYVQFPDDRKATVRQTVGGAQTTATLVGRIDATGPAATPRIAGGLIVSNLTAALPTLDTGGGDPAAAILDPTFDLTVALAQAGLFTTATADLYLTGDLSLKGRLSDPVATAELVTERGQIRLPGGLVRVDKGGQISFAYRRPLSGGVPASASIDLQGRSQITLQRAGATGSQRYDITLDIQGDLLRENGLRFDATSDPGDLSKDEILNALGGTELISGVAAGGSSAERNVRNAFAGFALPGLLDPVTGGLARGLGLDYVSLEYNAFDQATINFARSLGPDFSFQGRQQVGTPTPGYRSIYDLRLGFNPRRLLPKLSKLSFTLGTDQDRPWKASVEYGTRFGQRGGKPKPKHLLFPAGFSP